MATLSGVWVLNSTLERPTADIIQLVNFTSNGSNATRMTVKSSTSYALLNYMIINNIATYGTSWVDEAYRTVDFGTDEQTVSDAFYTWLVDNAAALGDNDEPQVDQQYAIKESSLIAIADAIREKTGKTDSLTLQQMATEISGIQTGGGGSMFVSSAVGIQPTIYEGTANSEFTLNFESSAVGALANE